MGGQSEFQEHEMGEMRGSQTGGRQERGGQQMGGQQTGRQRMAPSGAPGVRLDDNLTSEMRFALYDAHEAVKTCEWCADQCLGDSQMEQCARLCRDVADIGALMEHLIARDSIFLPEIAETFLESAEECAMECERHEHAHCQECATELRQAIESTDWMLQTMGQSQGQQPTQAPSR